MSNMGVSFGYLAVVLFNFLLLAVWVGLAIYALFQLRSRKIDDTARVIWVLAILLIPIFGAVAFWIIKPGFQGNLSPFQEQ